MAAKNFVAPCFVLFFTHFFIIRSWQQALLLKIQPAVHTDQVCETLFLQLSKATTPFFDICMITAKRNLTFIAWRFCRSHCWAAKPREKQSPRSFTAPALAAAQKCPTKPPRYAGYMKFNMAYGLLGRNLCYTFLLLCGDVMVNPSPRDKSQISPCGRFARGLCYRAVSWNESLCCDECGQWFHPHWQSPVTMPPVSLTSSGATWNCSSCDCPNYFTIYSYRCVD